MVNKRGSKSFVSKEKIELHRVAHYTFFLGLVVAIITGFFYDQIRSVYVGVYTGPQVLVTSLVLLGFVVGLFNLTAKETMPFLVASIALMLAGIVNLSLIPKVGFLLRDILSNMVVFVVPGAIILGMKTIWKMASD